MSDLIRESTGTPALIGPGRVELTIITPGKGSSGDYSAEVLAQAAKDKVWPRGTQGHVNHDTESERWERPEGDLRNLALVTTEDAVWEPNWVHPETGEKGRLKAEARVGSAWRPFIEEFGEFIGASIVAGAEVKDTPQGRLIERLIPGPFNRVDLVTVAGRGGRVEEIIESARRIENRAPGAVEVGHNDLRDWLSKAVRDAYMRTDTGQWAWLRDFDESNVWFEFETPDTAVTLYQQGYTVDGVDVTLTGDPIEVRAQVTYHPVTNDSPADPAGANESANTDPEEGTVATVQIDETELNQLRESASRVQTLEAENTTLREKDAANAAEARRNTAERIVNEAFGDLKADRTKASLVKAALAGEALDEDTLKTDATEAAAEIRSLNGEGQVHGLGGGTRATEGRKYTADDIVARLDGKDA